MNFNLISCQSVDTLVQLIDLCLVRPLGLVRNVLVVVNDLFPTDFYVIDVNASSPLSELSIM